MFPDLAAVTVCKAALGRSNKKDFAATFTVATSLL